jgi:hypothetical protein
MARSPSIVPGIDQDVYLVLDDLGWIGALGARAGSKIPTSKALLRICCKACIVIPFASSASIALRGGHETFRKT